MPHTQHRPAPTRHAAIAAPTDQHPGAPGRPNTLSIAMHGALLAMALGSVGALPTTVRAQSPGAAALPAGGEVKHFNVPAGPLDVALDRFARTAGVNLAYDAALLRGLTTPGLGGSHGVAAGLARLLAGTGLEALSQPGGGYSLRKAASAAAPPPAMPATSVAMGVVPAQDEGTLPTVTVKAQAVRDATSEGTGSYAPTYSDSATRLNLKPREIPQSVSVITRQMIEDKGLTTVEQVLLHTPGVTMVGDASQNSQIFVRGFYLESGILIDGLNTTSAQPVYEGSLSQGLDPAIADRVEVVKGATGIVAGLGSPAASVNFIRKRPTATFQARAETTLGSWNRVSGEVDIGGPANADASVRSRLVAAVRSGDSYIDRNRYQKAVLYGVIDVDLGADTTASLAIDHQRSDTDGAFNWNSNPAFYTDGGAFTPDASFSTSQKWTYWNVRQTSITPSLEHRFDNGWTGKIAVRRAEGDIDRVSFYPGDSVDRVTGTLVGAWSAAYADRHLRRSDTDSVDAYASGRFGWLGRQHDLAFGTSYGKNDFSLASYNSDTMAPYGIGSGAIAAPAISATPSYDNLYSQAQSGLFATARFNPSDALKLMVGGRMSRWKYTTGDRMQGTRSTVRHDDIFTPYLGMVYEVAKSTSAYASYTGVFRPVTNYGANGQLLDPAEGSNKEIGLKFGLFGDKLNLSVAAYETLEDNYPEWANLGRLPSGDWIYRSIDGVKTTGYEIELSGRPAPGWEISGGYTYNKAKDADGNAKLTYVPEHLLKVSANRQIGHGVTVGGSVRWQSESYGTTTVRANGMAIPARQEQEAYALLDLMTRWQVSPRYAVTLNLNNVFDKAYHRSMWGYADQGEPRNVVLALRGQW